MSDCEMEEALKWRQMNSFLGECSSIKNFFIPISYKSVQLVEYEFLFATLRNDSSGSKSKSNSGFNFVLFTFFLNDIMWWMEWLDFVPRHLPFKRILRQKIQRKIRQSVLCFSKGTFQTEQNTVLHDLIKLHKENLCARSP